MSFVIVYARISQDALNLRAGVTRQLEDGHRIAGVRWPGVEVREYVDNDTSAYKGKTRPEFTAMRHAIESRQVRAVVAYNLDRLFRQPRELESFIDLCSSVSLRDVVTCEGDLDLTSHDGQLMARIMVAVARKESDDKSRRQLRSVEQRRALGQPISRPSWPRRSVDNLAAASWACQQIVAGATLNSVFRRLPDVHPQAEVYSSARALSYGLRSPDIPVLLGEVGEHAQAILADPRRRASISTERTHWLSGVLTCVCGAKMNHRPVKVRSGPNVGTYTGVYRCPPTGCGKGSIAAHVVETWAYGLLVAETQVRARQIVETGAHVASVVEEQLIARRQKMSDMYAVGDLTDAEWASAKTLIQERLTALAHVETVEVITDLATRWESMTPNQKHELASRYLRTIRCLPATARGSRLDPDRLHPTWRR